ncbi:MAG: hypothetical protein R2710_01575 [Acidimicrobiales bacterium]
MRLSVSTGPPWKITAGASATESHPGYASATSTSVGRLMTTPSAVFVVLEDQRQRAVEVGIGELGP